MVIDVYAIWHGMTAVDSALQARCFGPVFGHLGYLQEDHHGGPYATKALVPEVFERPRATIPASLLRDRLPEILATEERRLREFHGATGADWIERVLKSYRDFVALCECKERATGVPCTIIATH